MALALVDATDESIMSVLRHELCKPPKFEIARQDLERAFAGWVKKGVLDDARVAGRLAVREKLHKAADSDDARESTPAATFLARRHEDMHNLEAHVQREVTRLLGLNTDELVAEIDKLRAKVKG